MLGKRVSLILLLFVIYGNVMAQKELNSQQMVCFEDNGIDIVALVQGKPVLQYNYKMQNPPTDKPDYYKRSGFLHPVYTPSGDTITEGFPQEHTHHHGIFDAWVNTEFKNEEIDFWNQQKQSGTVLFDSIISVKEGNDFGELRTRQLHVAIINKDTIPVLKEDWIIRIYNKEEEFVWDIQIKQKNIAKDNLKIQEYHYGGFAVRGRDEWNRSPDDFNSENYVDFRTNDGLSRLDANHTFPKWVTMHGRINKNFLSISVIPKTPGENHQDAVRIHPDMPYFCFTPITREGITLSPGETLEKSYRIITASNPVEVKKMKEYFEEF